MYELRRHTRGVLKHEEGECFDSMFKLDAQPHARQKHVGSHQARPRTSHWSSDFSGVASDDEESLPLTGITISPLGVGSEI